MCVLAYTQEVQLQLHQSSLALELHPDQSCRVVHQIRDEDMDQFFREVFQVKILNARLLQQQAESI